MVIKDTTSNIIESNMKNMNKKWKKMCTIEGFAKIFSILNWPLHLYFHRIISSQSLDVSSGARLRRRSRSCSCLLSRWHGRTGDLSLHSLPPSISPSHNPSSDSHALISSSSDWTNCGKESMVNYTTNDTTIREERVHSCYSPYQYCPYRSGCRFQESY